MNAQQEAEAEKHIKATEGMSLAELSDFAREWFMSKPDLNSKLFDKVKETLDMQMDELRQIPVSALVVRAENKDGEVS